MEIENYTTTFGEEWVKVFNDNDTYTCMPKADWEALEAAKENGTIS